MKTKHNKTNMKIMKINLTFSLIDDCGTIYVQFTSTAEPPVTLRPTHGHGLPAG